MVSDKQQIAIEMLLSGAKINDIVTAIGVSRVVIWQWRRHDADFIAQYNAEKNALVMANEQALFRLFTRAIDVLHDRMTEKEALALVKLFLGGVSFGCRENDAVTVAQVEKAQHDLEEALMLNAQLSNCLLRQERK